MKTSLKTFTCWGCGNCCRGDGYVQLTDADTASMAALLAISVETFTERYTVLKRNRRGLTLRDQADGACIFLKADGACAVYEARPQQCRDFPYKWNYPGWENLCENSCSLEKEKPKSNATPRE